MSCDSPVPTVGGRLMSPVNAQILGAWCSKAERSNSAKIAPQVVEICPAPAAGKFVTFLRPDRFGNAGVEICYRSEVLTRASVTRSSLFWP